MKAQASITKITTLILVVIVIVLTLLILYKHNFFKYFSLFPDDFTFSSDNNNIINNNSNNKIVDTFNKTFYYATTHDIKNKRCKCGDKCEEIMNRIYMFSAYYNVDKYLVLSTIIEESECNYKLNFVSWKNPIKKIWYSIKSSNKPIGLFGITKVNKNKYCKKLNINNIKNNIICGEIILLHLYTNDLIKYKTCDNKFKYYNRWDAALRRYKGLECNEDNYVENINYRYKILRNKFNTS